MEMTEFAKSHKCDADWLMLMSNREVVALTPGQAAMAKGCATVWREIAPKLAARGVTVVTQD